MSDEFLPIRGHHLLCMLGFKGMGYSDDFIRNMQLVVDRVTRHPETVLALTTECDAICRACPFQKNGRCAKPKEGKRRPGDADRALLTHIGLTPNTRIAAGEAYRLVAASLDVADLGTLFCAGCGWRRHGFCATGLGELKARMALPADGSAGLLLPGAG